MPKRELETKSEPKPASTASRLVQWADGGIRIRVPEAGLLGRWFRRGLPSQAAESVFEFPKETDLKSLKESVRYRALLGLGAPLSDDDIDQIRRNSRLYCALWLVNREALSSAFGKKAKALFRQHATRTRLGGACYRALVSPADVTLEDLAEIEADDTTLMAVSLAKIQRVFECLGEKYRLPAPMVAYFMDLDLNWIRSLLVGKRLALRFETYPTRALSRLETHRKNHSSIEGITELFALRRHAFFDVGCLFGSSMVSAQTLGYELTHGCELNEATCAQGNWIAEWMKANRPGDFRYYGQEFSTLELPEREYTLVTVNNVLEHTPDLDGTVAQLARILADDGMIYIYQGNHESINFARFEPHYRLPFLTLLPKELAIDILIRLKRISRREAYVVTRWPDYDELPGLFAKHGLDATFHEQSLGFWSAPAPLQPAQVENVRKAFWTEAKNKIFGVLTPEEQDRVAEIGESYFRSIAESVSRDPQYAHFRYLKPTWDITVTRTRAEG